MTSDSPVRERSWFHWGLIVAGLYATWFVALTMPVVILCFPSSFINAHLSGLLDVYKEWPCWIVIGVFSLSQFLFLRVPVRVATRRPVSRQSIWLPVIISGFWFGCLALGGSASLIELVKGFDKGFNPFLIMGITLASWLVWIIVFFLTTRTTEPKKSIAWQTRGLLGGSILELLIAVPSHVVARGRSECCAGLMTFVGITMGISVMLLSFGPAVFLLYHARWRHLKSATD